NFSIAAISLNKKSRMKNDFDSRVRENFSAARTDFGTRDDNPPFGSQDGAPPPLDDDVNAGNESVMSRPPFQDPVVPSSGRCRAFVAATANMAPIGVSIQSALYPPFTPTRSCPAASTSRRTPRGSLP